MTSRHYILSCGHYTSCGSGPSLQSDSPILPFQRPRPTANLPATHGPAASSTTTSPALAVTIYNGRQRWTAPDNVFDLIEPVRGWLAERQPKLRHQVLDLRVLAREPQTAAEPNVVAWIASMELDPSVGNVTRVVREVLAAYGRPQHAPLREAFREWVLGAAESWGIGEEVLEEVKSLKEAGMIYAGVEEQKEQAHREGRATLLSRLARQKFGARTAERLSRLLEDITDPEGVARIGDQIIECETGEELLARVREG